MPTSSPSSSNTTASPSGEGDDDGAAAWLDLAGEVCPFTFVRARLALEALPLGARLRVRVDHAPARRNVPRSAVEWGQELVGVTEEASGAAWIIELVKRVP